MCNSNIILLQLKKKIIIDNKCLITCYDYEQIELFDRSKLLAPIKCVRHLRCINKLVTTVLVCSFCKEPQYITTMPICQTDSTRHDLSKILIH
jgi:hypothetical protein